MRETDFPVVTMTGERVEDPLGNWEQLSKHGAVIFRGMAATEDSMMTVTTTFADDFITYPDNQSRRTVNPSGTIQTVHSGVNGLLLHSELSYSPFRPDLIWFQCIVPPPGDSGRTLLCDGAEVFRRFSPSTLEDLGARWLLYRDEIPPDFWGHLFGTSSLSEAMAKCEKLGLTALHFEGNILHVDYRQPVLARSRFSNLPVFCNNLHHDRFDHFHMTYDDGTLPASEIYEEIASKLNEATRFVPWQSGDIVMVDNTRLLHGRTAVGKTNRTIHSRFGWATPALRRASESWMEASQEQINAAPVYQ